MRIGALILATLAFCGMGFGDSLNCYEIRLNSLDTNRDKPTPNVHHSTRLNVNADFAWHPDGDRIVSGMYCPERRRIQLYELNPKRDAPPTLFPGQDETRNNTDVCWTPDGKQLIVVSGDF